MFPKLALAVGVVSASAFRSVVNGVEEAKQEMLANGKEALLFQLSKTMDAARTRLVATQKQA